MIRKLTPENKGNDALKEYIGYIQSTESYEEVARKIRKLAAKSGLVMKEENLIQKFVEAIKPELMIAIASARPRTLDAAVYDAKRLDSIAQLQASRSRLEYEINSASTNKQERQSSEQSTSSIEKRAQANGPKSCYECCNPDHFR
jgi:hypothetical protein